MDWTFDRIASLVSRGGANVVWLASLYNTIHVLFKINRIAFSKQQFKFTQGIGSTKSRVAYTTWANSLNQIQVSLTLL
jgi:hypothetical protein